MSYRSESEIRHDEIQTGIFRFVVVVLILGISGFLLYNWFLYTIIGIVSCVVAYYLIKVLALFLKKIGDFFAWIGG